MKKSSIALLIIIYTLICASLAQAEELSLSLDEALAIALRDNRDIQLKNEDINKAKAKIAEAKSALLPTATFNGTWTDTIGLYPKSSNPASIIPQPTHKGGFSSTATQLSVKQVLYKGGQILNNIQYNKFGLEISQALLDKTKLETALNVKKAFYTLLLTMQLADLNKSILDNAAEHLSVIEARYQSGQASESDILNIKSSLSSVWQAYEESLNQVEAAGALLRNLLYLDKNVTILAQGQFEYMEQELAYDEAFLKALKSRPEIKQYEAQSKAAGSAVEIAKANGRPSIYASWDYYSKSHLAGTTTKNWNDYNVLGLTFSWPIFDGFATKHKVEQALIDLKEAQLAKEKSVNDIILELRSAYLSLKDAISRINAVEADLVLYKNNLATAEEKYKEGIASMQDKNDADLKYAISQFNKNQAVYDYIIAKSSFDKATGGI